MKEYVLKRYGAIIDHPNHKSKTRPHMSMEARAAQFAPFAALTGYGEAIDATGERAIQDYIPETEAIDEIIPDYTEYSDIDTSPQV